MIRKRPKERLPERRVPGEPEPERCAPGSIEQQLDMCEEGSLRGDEILHHPGDAPDESRDRDQPVPLDRMTDRFRVDLSEEGREGAEASGDEHSSGLQGGESELAAQPRLETGLPGDLTRRTEILERRDWEREEDEKREREFPEGAPRHVIRKVR